MSARNIQSDTSHVVVKNPLLSAVAGSIDDFVNSTILLPAAEIPAPVALPPQTHDIQDLKDSRDATKSVIYGSEPPAVLDSDKFSEISLDQPVDAELTTSQPEYNPLQNLDTFSPIATDEHQQQQRDDTLFNPLAQAAAIKDSLSQLPGVLPGVASSVFSSFSSILKGRISPHPSGADAYASNTPSYSSQYADSQKISSVNQYPCFYDQSNQQQSGAPPVVPTFYSPTDPNITRPEASLSPSSSEAQSNNLYRLKERKKLYAPIPGLNANNSGLIPPNPSASPAVASASVPGSVAVPAPAPAPAPIPQASPGPSNQNTSFSFSSFFSGAPLLDKVLPKSPEITANSNQESANSLHQISFHSPNPATAAAPAQFFNPNTFNTSNPEPSISVAAAPSFQTVSASNQQVPPIVSSNSFNLNPFQKSPAQIQTTTPAAASTAQLFNVSAPPLQGNSVPISESPIIQKPPETAIPSVPQLFNPTSPLNAPPLQTTSFNQPPIVTADSFNLNPFHKPATPHQPPASSSPALVQQAVIPASYLSQNPTPPAGQAVSYRLKGKPLYKKPIQSTQFVNQPANLPSTQLFDPVSASSSVSPSNLNILNPLTFESSPQILGQVQNAEFSSVQSPNNHVNYSHSAVPPPVNVFTPFVQPTPNLDNIHLNPSVSKEVHSSESVVPPVSVFTPFSQPQSSLDNSKLPPPAVTSQSASVAPPPVSVFTPFSQPPSSLDNSSLPPPAVTSQSASVAPPPVSGFTPLSPLELKDSSNLQPSLTTAQPEIVDTSLANVLTPFTQPTLNLDNDNQYPPVLTPRSESFAPPPVSAFAPSGQPQSKDNSDLNPQVSTSPPESVAASELPSVSLGQDHQTIAQQTNISSLNPFTTEPFSSAAIIEPLSSAPAQLGTYFGNENSETGKALSEHKPISTIEQTDLQSTTPATNQSAIGNFFESTPYDPFHGAQQNFDLDNSKQLSSNANIENVNTEIKNLSFDKDNNLIEESAVQSTDAANLKTTETTFDPISFFNNNTTEQIPSDSSNANEYQIQNFFTEPPPLSDLQENVQEKNFNFIRTNLLNKRIERIANAETASPETLSVASVIAEPGSESERSYADPPAADVTSQSLQSSLDNNQDQSDGINIYNWLNKQEPHEMAATPIERTSTPATSSSTNIAYRPVYKHWFYKTTSESKRIWIPFSFPDSMLLEEAFLAKDKTVVTTDGGRFDVNIPQRTRTSAYWTAESNEVRRCSWFYKGIDFRLIPYEEDVAEQLEEEYKDASHTGEWQRKIPLTSGETVVFNGPSDILHFLQSQSADGWNNAVQNTEVRPRGVKRGTDEFAIDDGEPEQIDHLLFMVHGIGSACDLKFRKVEEVVDEFRSIALQLVQSHYRSSCDQGIVGRVEVLPISWHSELHSEESGIDEKLKSITLESIPKLRNFTNDTLLDILFYTSPVFCQQIIDAVSGNLNKCYAKFCERNPDFHGSVSVSGHSLGSVILFDLLQHQRIEIENSENLENANRVKSPLKRHCSQQINYTIGHAGTGQPYISYPQLSFQPKHFFALGSPIGMFVTVRGIDALGLDFKLPTTKHFFNIFHPYDPVAYRIEALVNAELQSMRPVLVPHHKGRKRMHLELRETVARVGADIKQKILQTLRTTIDTVYSYTTLHKAGPNDTKAIQQEVNKVIDEQLTLDELETSGNTSSASSEIDTGETDLSLGKMNGGRRIDYVLQEAPLEIINEYLFALTSHVCYWGSEDATLFIMKEIYSSLGVQADTKIPQPTMTIERPSPANSVKSSPTTG